MKLTKKEEENKIKIFDLIFKTVVASLFDSEDTEAYAKALVLIGSEIGFLNNIHLKDEGLLIEWVPSNGLPINQCIAFLSCEESNETKH